MLDSVMATESSRSPMGRLRAAVRAGHQQASAQSDGMAQLREYTRLLAVLNESVDAVSVERDRVLARVMRSKGAPSHGQLSRELGVSRQRVSQVVQALPARRRPRAAALRGSRTSA